MLPSRLKTRTNSLLKLSAMSLVVATLSGCGEDAKDCGGFWDKTFGREECVVSQPTSQNVTKTSQTITDLALPNPFTVGQSYTLAAKSSAGLTVAYSSKTTDVCSVTDTVVKALKAGTCTIETTQAGDDKTLAAEIINASTTVDCDDSAGCRVSEQEITLAKDTQFISVQEAKKITDTDIDATTGTTTLKVSTDSTLAKMAVGKIAMIDGGKDSIYPLGLTGRVASSQTIDGVQEIELTPVTLAEAFNKVDVNVAIPLNENTILRTITPTLNDDVVSPVAKSARFAKTSASATKSRGEFAFLSAKYPNKLAGLANGQFIKTDKTETGTEIKFDRPFYDFDGDPSTTNDQIMFTASWKLEDTQQKNEIYFDKSDLFKPVKSVNVQFSGKSTVNGKLSGELKADIADLLDYSAVWEKFEKQAINDAGTASITGLSKDDKKGLIPLVCWVTSNPLALTPVTSQDQFGTVLTVNSALGAVVCVSVKLTMGATGKVEVGLEVSNQDMRYGITGTVDNNGTLNAQMINELQPNAKDLESHKTEIKLPYLKFDGEIKHEFGFDAALDVFVAGIRPVSIGAMVGYGTGVKLRGEVGFKAERLRDLSRYGDFCFSDVQIGMGLKARALAAFGVKVDVNIPVLGKTTIDAGGAGAWYIPKPDDTSQGWQGAWYNLADKTAMCAGKAKVEIPYLVGLQGPSTSAGYPVKFTWPEAKAENFDIATIATDKKSWMMIIDGKEYPFEPTKEQFYTHVFDTIGEHQVTLKVIGQLGGAAEKTVKITVKGTSIKATPNTTTVGSVVQFVVDGVNDMLLNVGQKIKEIFWTVVNAFGETITTMKTAVNATFEHVFDRRGDYAVSAQIYDESLQAISPKLNQSISIQECTQDCPAMLVIGVSPTTMAVNEPITIEVLAENVPSTAVFALDGAVCSTPLLSANAQGYVKITEVCTPIKTGTTKLSVKSQAGLTSGFTTVDVNVVAAKQVKGAFVVPAKSEGVVFVPPLDNEPAIGELGYVLEYGASRRNMTCSFTSTGQTKTYRSYDLVDANGYSTEVLPLLNGFPNMALIANSTLIGKEKTGLTVAAGQSLNFKLNDDSYGDNEGALTVAYSCEEVVQSEGYTVLNRNGSECVQDNKTGLIWEQKTDDGGLRHKNWTYMWYDSNPASNGGFAGYPSGGNCSVTSPCTTQAYVAALNATNYCGYSDWRMPAINELQSLVNTAHQPKTAPVFVNTLGVYWSASLGADQYANVLGMDFNSGLSETYNKNNPIRVRAVRTGVPQPTWTINPTNGHQYAAVDCGTWTQCEAQAVALGAHLVSVNDVAENEWLVSTFTPTKNYWIGLTDKDQEGVWKWTSGEAFGYNKWMANQPDNYSGYIGGGVIGEDFVHVNYHFPNQASRSDGYWNDVSVDTAYVTTGLFEKSPDSTFQIPIGTWMAWNGSKYLATQVAQTAEYITNATSNWGGLRVRLPQMIDGDNFKVELRAKNDPSLGGVWAWDLGFSVSNDFSSGQLSATGIETPSKYVSFTMTNGYYQDFFVIASDSGQAGRLNQSGAINTRVWHNYVLTAKDHVVSLYSDGVLIYQQGYTGTVGMLDTFAIGGKNNLQLDVSSLKFNQP